MDKLVEHYACDKSPKIVTKSVQLPKPGQTIKCKFTNDEDHEWRKLNVISRAGKATGKKQIFNECCYGRKRSILAGF